MTELRGSRHVFSCLRQGMRRAIAVPFAAGLAVFAAFGLSPAGATTLLTPQIDFRDSLFAAADKQRSFSATVDGIGFTLTAEKSNGNGRAKLWWDATDGIGVRSGYEKDEIDGNDILRLTFDRTIGLSELYISDLFVESGYAEIGTYRIDGGDLVVFDAATLAGTDGNKANGEQLITIDPVIPVNEIVFMAPGVVGGQTHEFSLLGLTDPPLQDTPEPGTLAGFALGLLGLRLAQRRRQQAAG